MFLPGDCHWKNDQTLGDRMIQHLREVAIDHQNGIFAGTNDLVEKIGGRPPMTLEEFISKNRAAFA
jgi:NAD(P)H dehydrogenase (quinone)